MRLTVVGIVHGNPILRRIGLPRPRVTSQQGHEGDVEQDVVELVERQLLAGAR